ncbi:DUF5132 domain-containing protein [Terricaulis sp.]|uniref:DUF5132 domain-containing protein n=1 Tax=Terricaulis sp. TaxID=2768686 RepID=UPI0037836171
MPFLGRVVGAALVLAGAAAAVAAVVAAPKVLRAARPLARATLKYGMDLYERTRTASAEFADDVEDLVAEVRADLTKSPGAPAE